MKKLIAISTILVLVSLLFSACGSDAPANVEITDTSVTWTWSYTIGTGTFRGVGTATNNGEQTANMVEVRLILYTGSNSVMSQATWNLIFTQLTAGSSEGFLTTWLYTDRSLENAASYAIEVRWSEGSDEDSAVMRTFTSRRQPLQ